MTRIITLTPEIEEQANKLCEAFETLPDIMINIAIKTGLNELQNAFELLPEKTKLLLKQDLKSLKNADTEY